MSMGKRAYNILRGYVYTEWDRIKDVERELASRELRAPEPEPPQVPAQPPTPIPTPIVSTPVAEVDQKAYARKLLGVSDDCTFDDIRKAYTRLNKRSDPSNFPSGTQEAKKAAELHRNVNWAYNLLTATQDSTERRFRSLELD